MSINENCFLTNGNDCECGNYKKPFIIGVSGGTSSGKVNYK